ncbi:MAG: MFS transporter [Acidobacteriota bacterium]|nr:MFS transporter [Acidobacteriota bacterium]
MTEIIESQTLPKNDRREIFGWVTYDWANSAFYTIVVTVLCGPYLTALAQADVGKNGIIFDLGFIGSITAESLLPNALALSVVSQVCFLPILGSLADYTNLKKKMMAFFCYFGVIVSCLLFFITGANYIWGYVFLILANMSFAATNVFYNAYLIDITTEDKRDKISSYGFAAGYFAGFIILVASLLFINNVEFFGISEGLAVRISMLIASLWWGVFALITFLLIKNREPDQLPRNENLVTVGFKELFVTLKQLVGLRHTLLFLIAYLFYNDGIQTVILASSTFLEQEFFISKGLEPDKAFLLGIFIVAQLFAVIGSIIFERISRVIGPKKTIMICLTIWGGIVVFAYGFLTTQFQAWIMGAFIGLVLGSTQALSRSLFSQMIPKGRESSFFGLYEISEKGTSWLGNIVFAIVIASTGSYRQAILCLIIFFAVGIIILLFTDTAKAIHDAGNLTPKEAAEKL